MILNGYTNEAKLTSYRTRYGNVEKHTVHANVIMQYNIGLSP